MRVRLRLLLGPYLSMAWLGGAHASPTGHTLSEIASCYAGEEEDDQSQVNVHEHCKVYRNASFDYEKR